VNSTASDGTATGTNDSAIAISGVPSTIAEGNITAAGITFDFSTTKDLFSRKRLVYVPRRTTSEDREVEVAAVPRTAPVPRQTTSSDRTVMVAAENRKVYIPRRSTSAERTAEAA